MEENNSSIFIDSNFYIALYNPQDTLHERAKFAIDDLEKKNLRVILSNFIFMETVTVLSQKAGRELAFAAGKRLLMDQSFIIINEKLNERSWEIFQEIQRKNVSFVDCSILAVMELEGIDSLLTFDTEDFRPLQKKYHFKLYL